jgi:predicted  nucleic acid-binding Zn-ribbon protein
MMMQEIYSCAQIEDAECSLLEKDEANACLKNDIRALKQEIKAAELKIAQLKSALDEATSASSSKLDGHERQAL